MEETFIYVIAASDQGPVKVGYSRNPDTRVRQLQTGHSDKLILWYKQSVPSKLARSAEQAVHAQIGYRRKVGEWFMITVEDAILEVKFGLMSY